MSTVVVLTLRITYAVVDVDTSARTDRRVVGITVVDSVCCCVDADTCASRYIDVGIVCVVVICGCVSVLLTALLWSGVGVSVCICISRVHLLLLRGVLSLVVRRVSILMV